jgi:TRAP-type C4-dicarboxylate transport system substrate-binding protein
MSNTQTIRWLIAHEPVKLFLRTAEAFSSKINELTDGKFKVEIYTPTQYLEQAGKDANSFNFAKDNGPMMELEEGNIEMSQLHISELGQYHNQDFFALELPFLFRDHDHAATVFEGPIGKGLLSSLADKSPARGLAFTYSGGFRCIASEDKITSLDSIHGLKFATGTNPVTIDTVTAMGAVADPFPIKDHAKKFAQEGWSADMLETTIPRYLAQFQNSTKRNLTNTKHSLFLTSIIVSNKFWATLDAATQAAFQEASLYASRLERQWSVEDADNFAAKADHSDIGVTYSELTEDQTAELKAKTAPLYTKYADFFSPSLVDGIIKS